MYKKNALYFPGEFNIDKDVTLLCLHFTKVKIGSQSSNTPNLTNSIKYNSIYNVTSTIVEFFLLLSPATVTFRNTRKS
jgi:hypothetical protein